MSTDLLISKSQMAKVIREVTQSVTPPDTGFRFTSTAIAALHVAAEDYSCLLYISDVADDYSGFVLCGVSIC